MLWLAQLVVPGLILTYGAFRLGKGYGLGRVMWPAVLVSAAWVLAALFVAVRRRGRAWLVGRRHQLGLAVVSLALTVVILDVLVTVTGLSPTMEARRKGALEYRPSLSTQNRLVPKTVVLGDLPPLTINSRGYHGPEIATPKPKGTTRIVFLGGSQVFDWYWSDGENWPLRTAELLSQEGRTVDAVNAGVPAHNSSDSLGKLLTDLWLLEPDVIVVVHAANDLVYIPDLSADRPYCDLIRPYSGDYRLHPTGLDRVLCVSGLYRMERLRLLEFLTEDNPARPGEPAGGRPAPPPPEANRGLDQYRLNLRTLCDVGKSIGAKVVLCQQARLPVVGLPQSSRITMKGMAQPRGAWKLPGAAKKPVPAGAPDTIPADDTLIVQMAACDRVVEEVAREKGCLLIDMNGPLSGRVDLFDDDIHFNRAGSRRAAELVAEELKKIVPSNP